MNKDNLNLIGKYIFSFLCIVAGCAIYVMCNESGYHGFVRNFVPDFLWMIAFMFVLAPLFRFIFNNDSSSDAIAWIVCNSLGAIFELCQYVGIINGTGDSLDVATYMLAGFVSMLYFIIEDAVKFLKEDKNG